MKSTYDHSEQAQLEQLKEWWKQYGVMTIVTIVIALCAGSGWRYWQHVQEQKLERASQIYQDLLDKIDSQQLSGIDQKAHDLIEQYPRTEYANLATLFLAQQSAQKKDFPQTEARLNAVIKQSASPALRQIARIRLARVLLETKRIEEAFSMLETIEEIAYMPLIQAVKGDLHHAAGNIQEAKNAYQQAIKNPFIDMKLNNL